MTYFWVKEVVEYDERERGDMVEVEDHNDSTEESKRIGGQLVKGHHEVGENFFNKGL